MPSNPKNTTTALPFRDPYATERGGDSQLTQGYAKGGPVETPDPREHKPFVRAANPLTQLARGWAAGTAGLPGDIEGLTRLIAKYVSAPGSVADRYSQGTPVLPTSDFYREWLPGRDAAVGGSEMEALGSLFGGAGSTALVRPVAPGLRAVGNLAATGARAGARNLAVPSQLSRQAGVIKAPGGNWLSGSIESGLSGLKKTTSRYENPNLTAEEVVSINTSPINTWVDKQLTRYVKNEMATPGDPVRALAERGTLHFAPDWVPDANMARGRAMTTNKGENVSRAGKTPLAQDWEDLADTSIAGETAAHWRANAKPDVLERIPGLEKIPAEAPIYERTNPSMNESLGFDHLIDELRNASDPASGLPRELLVKPESMARMSVPQAVERVAKINEWRAAQKIAADQARAQNPATVLHKDYPDKGFKWVELRGATDKPAEGYTITPVEAKNGTYWKVEGPGFKYPSSASTEAEAIAQTHKPALADALKYEGDTMGHCVGGYCPDVIEGKSRIFSLRSAKGEPHVTIETQPYGSHNEDIMFAELTDKLGRQPNAQELSEAMSVAPQRIKQIKGKANRAPNPEYLPFVQDFVKSGQWSDVGDARNAGLRKFTDVFNNKELRSLQEAGAELPNSGWLTGEDIQGLHNMITPEGKRLQYDASGNIVGGFAAGGAVDAVLPDMQDGGQVYNDPSTPQAGQPMRNGGPVTLDMMRLALQQRK